MRPYAAQLASTRDAERFAGYDLAALPASALAPSLDDCVSAVATVRAALGLAAPRKPEEQEAAKVVVNALAASGLSRGELDAATRAMIADPDLAERVHRYRRPLLASDFVRAVRGTDDEGRLRPEADGAAGRLYTYAEALDVCARRGVSENVPTALFEIVPVAGEGKPLWRLR